MTSASSAVHAGGCQCGAVRYTFSGPISGANICHCRMCQKAGGAPFMAFAGGPVSSLRFTSGQPTYFASSDIATRGFCAACGTPLTYFLHGRDRVVVTIASLDKPNSVAPEIQFGIESALYWFPQLAGLPGRQTSDWLSEAEFGPIGNHQHPDGDD